MIDNNIEDNVITFCVSINHTLEFWQDKINAIILVSYLVYYLYNTKEMAF